MHALARHRKIDYFLCVTGGIFSALVCPGYLILVLRSPTTFPTPPVKKSDLIVNTYEIDIDLFYNHGVFCHKPEGQGEGMIYSHVSL